MFTIILAAALFGQVSEPQSTEELKSWLLSRLIVELKFDEAKITQVGERLDRMSDREIRILINVYKDRIEKRDQAEYVRQQYMQQMLENQAKLDLQRAQAFKEHLKREYDRSILQGKMEQNLVRQNIQNNNRAVYGGFGGNSGGFQSRNQFLYRW